MAHWISWFVYSMRFWTRVFQTVYWIEWRFDYWSYFQSSQVSTHHVIDFKMVLLWNILQQKIVKHVCVWTTSVKYPISFLTDLSRTNATKYWWTFCQLILCSPLFFCQRILGTLFKQRTTRPFMFVDSVINDELKLNFRPKLPCFLAHLFLKLFIYTF